MAKFLKIDGIIGTAVVLDPTDGNTLKLVATNDCSGNPVLAVQDPGGTDIAIRASNVSEAGVQYLSFDIDFSDIGTPVDSTTTLPQNAVVMDLGHLQYELRQRCSEPDDRNQGHPGSVRCVD